ncbi:tRNA (adenosine(37)-N6)-threonylcarbamoyltransferase complex dimerization subunit type 1 TsaB [Erysipelotrichaceae bacterium Oil+RF-744-GAM-WT-6]|jgi:tRNA threonylcarbamoyladenosine biosynthesis protein TsaB|uniref:tRNA (Adenosine(37)-N6)-threonylcarbamoyltransferase complex dimerization subunit type 1 TsaB n=1 Tax=Stecheria intestinalis TaxID=2606630 RepID=A0A7X2NUJ5_9FIRM|nr:MULTISPECIES: tRNA (adenosine(37)-N6)-threonylcarbamoyltransferase complex dimerization subunit type 1 TsaB [Erysipelotrichaceae]MDD5881853.1 tRNA (adenosine(37)-N6)-threonylcarbamoyltransferase complex dimerization subunit type 1 TsaB [Stecheria intestinalis]MSS59799.1 tRNA (adenosine(37)-N6)-threonylcarbamoyltransferase complex dimerization subunit type 1 TsaB [Stecheria intestinalis]
MITLCMDTSTQYLVIALIRDDQIVAKFQEKCWKKQSEELFPRLMDLMKEAGLEPEDIGQVVVSEGPGSYTGVRIAMTVAKVFCAMRNLPIATVGTLQLFAGMEPRARVVLDARGGRVYTAVYEYGVLSGTVEAKPCEEVKAEILEAETVIGDGSLVGREDHIPDLAENFLALKDQWKYAENVHLVKPEYLKSSESYLPHHQ